MLALDAQVGDVAVRTDLSQSFILAAEPASALANWQELLTPPDAVLSVNGRTGAVTILSTDVTSALGFTPGSVNSVDASGGTTGLSFAGGPVTSTGTLTLGGTLALTNGGTGATTVAGAQAALQVDPAGTAVALAIALG